MWRLDHTAQALSANDPLGVPPRDLQQVAKRAFQKVRAVVAFSSQRTSSRGFFGSNLRRGKSGPAGFNLAKARGGRPNNTAARPQSVRGRRRKPRPSGLPALVVTPSATSSPRRADNASPIQRLLASQRRVEQERDRMQQQVCEEERLYQRLVRKKTASSAESPLAALVDQAMSGNGESKIETLLAARCSRAYKEESQIADLIARRFKLDAKPGWLNLVARIEREQIYRTSDASVGDCSQRPLRVLYKNLLRTLISEKKMRALESVYEQLNSRPKEIELVNQLFNAMIQLIQSGNSEGVKSILEGLSNDGNLKKTVLCWSESSRLRGQINRDKSACSLSWYCAAKINRARLSPRRVSVTESCTRILDLFKLHADELEDAAFGGLVRQGVKTATTQINVLNIRKKER